MFFEADDDDDPFFNPDVYHIVSRDLYTLGAFHPQTRQGVRNVPTHTEDGIPIRKLYVSNLPTKTTRTELFGLFAQYGFIKSCWLRMGERGPFKSPAATYAFVTYSNPADAHKALQAASIEKTLRGRHLKVSPADSWHQPLQDADGTVRWRVHTYNHNIANTEQGSSAPAAAASEETPQEPQTSTAALQLETPADPEESPECDDSYDILDILNSDCLTHVLSYIPIIDIIRSERVSKRWQSVVQDYLQGMRTFKTSWWEQSPSTLTTAVLRRVLQRVGRSLTKLHIDHHWSALNDRTAHIVGKFCPNLEEIKVIGMHTTNWNPLIYGCTMLKTLIFVSCSKLSDTSLMQIMKNDSSVERLTVANNSHVTGMFLSSTNTPKLSALSFNNCYSLQGAVLCAATRALPNLTCLKLDMCPIALWKVVHHVISQLPKLEELSLSDYTSIDCVYSQSNEFSNAIANLTELKKLNLSRNIYVTNAILKQVAQTCTKLEELDISSCNPRKGYPGITDESISAICTSCRQLSRLDVSYLAALSDAGLAHVAKLPRLTELTARGNPAISARPLAACLVACPLLQIVDVCGCNSVSEEIACAAVRALEAAPRQLTLHLASTAAAAAEDIPTHRLLQVKYLDLCHTKLRPDFVDDVFDDQSDDSFDSFDDFYEQVDVNDLFDDDEDDDISVEDFYGYGLQHGPDIFIL